VHGIYLRPSSLCVLLGFLRGTVGIAEDAQPALLLAKCSQSTCSWHLLPCLHKLKGKPSLKYKNLPAFLTPCDDNICQDKTFFKEVDLNKQNRIYSIIFSTGTKAIG